MGWYWYLLGTPESPVALGGYQGTRGTRGTWYLSYKKTFFSPVPISTGSTLITKSLLLTFIVGTLVPWYLPLISRGLAVPGSTGYQAMGWYLPGTHPFSSL